MTARRQYIWVTIFPFRWIWGRAFRWSARRCSPYKQHDKSRAQVLTQNSTLKVSLWWIKPNHSDLSWAFGDIQACISHLTFCLDNHNRVLVRQCWVLPILGNLGLVEHMSFYPKILKNLVWCCPDSSCLVNWGPRPGSRNKIVLSQNTSLLPETKEVKSISLPKAWNLLLIWLLWLSTDQKLSYIGALFILSL